MNEMDGALAKLTYLREQVDALRSIPAQPAGPVAAWVARGVRYCVQTAVEAMIDLCYHLSAKRLKHAPTNAHDALDALAQAGLVPGEPIGRWHHMIGLRNRLVRGYEQISDDRLKAEVDAGLADFDAFIAAVASLIPR